MGIGALRMPRSWPRPSTAIVPTWFFYRRHFIHLHSESPDHCRIIVCSRAPDLVALTSQIARMMEWIDIKLELHGDPAGFYKPLLQARVGWGRVRRPLSGVRGMDPLHHPCHGRL